MKKSVAVWLIDNTCLTFEQIAEACGLHVLEVNAIADGESSKGIVGCDPRITGEIDQKDIEECEEDSAKRLTINYINQGKKKKSQGAKGTSTAVKRGIKPGVTLWLIQNYPQLSDSQIVSLVKTTPKIVKSIRNKTYWNYENLKPKDPLFANLYSQEDFEEILLKVNIAEQSEKEMIAVQESAESTH